MLSDVILGNIFLSVIGLRLVMLSVIILNVNYSE
jgi:hypothetical protein